MKRTIILAFIALALIVMPVAHSQTVTTLHYFALLKQSGTDAPTAIVKDNELGGEIVFTRLSVGTYKATLPFNVAPEDFAAHVWRYADSDTDSGMQYFTQLGGVGGEDNLYGQWLIIYVKFGDELSDGQLSNTPLEIRYWPPE
jgi:hypothetical protein